MLVRHYRPPAPRLLSLGAAAALLDKVGISGRTLVAVALLPANELLLGCRPGEVLPEPLGAGRTNRMRLSPPHNIEADGVPYQHAVVRWPETCAALLAAGCYGADRLPRDPGWQDPETGEEIPVEQMRAQKAWWCDAADEAPGTIDHEPVIPSGEAAAPADNQLALVPFFERDDVLIAMAEAGVRPAKTQDWKRTGRQVQTVCGVVYHPRTLQRRWKKLNLPTN
jgi:hypothetical protein